jgi:uncharacterized radical SAM superfamily Fe-S cluster-containing enzyme
VNFQPATQVGRHRLDHSNSDRITIPEILDIIAKQTSGLLKNDNFIHIPCPYPTCSVCTYVYNHNNKPIVLTDLFELDNYMKHFKDRTLPDMDLLSEVDKALDTLLSMSSTMTSTKTGEALCTTCGIAIPNIKDEHNFDLRRAKKCCVTEILPNGQMIPFCIYNILKRDKLTSTFGNKHR